MSKEEKPGMKEYIDEYEGYGDWERADYLPEFKHPGGSANKSFSKDQDVDPGDDVREVANPYERFYRARVNEWESDVLKALDKVETVEKLYSSDWSKSFGQFVTEVFNNVNTQKFQEKLRGIIRNIMLQGTEDAEKELGVDIGIGENFSRRLTALEEQQLNGYTVGGKRWHGIKGATDDLRKKILQTVQEDVTNRASKKEMREHIQDIFEGSTKAQADRIARTESNRFINEAKLSAYKDSGLVVYKAWHATMDGRTRDSHRDLHNEYYDKGIPLDQPFRKSDGTEVMTPPADPNCRCVLEARVPDSE